MIDLSQFTAVADCIVLDKRICSRCGHVHTTVSKRIMRVWNAHTGSARRMILPRDAGASPLDTLTTHCVETQIDCCADCWEPNAVWSMVASIRPDAPATPRTIPNSFALPRKMTLEEEADLL